MSEEQANFKVTDRRLFNPDGSARDVPPEEKPEPVREAKADEIPSQAAPSAPPATAQAEVTGDSGAEAPEESPAESPAQAPSDPVVDEAEEELIGAEDPASFANFMMSIASNAASSLGMMEHPATGKREVDLELGKHWIDILGMLQQKTRGNLLPQEQQVLEGLLADLRMQFVSLSNATPPIARKFSGSDITGAK
ncbi:MAG TPA: DUF1844 domain-containing protein [Pyrinomonadaceae bacterium]|nr:DUF1844 domain-containing protein [Pyrinomonadaceae bacterium]